MNPLLIGILAPIALIFLVVAFVLSRYKVAGPHEAYIITGRKGSPVTNPETQEVTTDLSGQKVVMGASVFVLPFVQRLACWTSRRSRSTSMSAQRCRRTASDAPSRGWRS